MISDDKYDCIMAFSLKESECLLPEYGCGSSIEISSYKLT